MNEKNDTMDELITLWEEETGLQFDGTFAHPGSDACIECFFKGIPCDSAPCKGCKETGAGRYTSKALPPGQTNPSKYGAGNGADVSTTAPSASSRWYKNTKTKATQHKDDNGNDGGELSNEEMAAQLAESHAQYGERMHDNEAYSAAAQAAAEGNSTEFTDMISSVQSIRMSMIV